MRGRTACCCSFHRRTLFARAINYICVASELHIYIAQGIKTLIADLQVAKPSVMIVVPRVLEKVYNAASQKAGHGAKGVAFAAAVVAAQNYMKEVSAKGKAGALAKARRMAFDPVVYASLREVLGGRAQWIVAGGAPLDPELWRSSVAPECPCMRVMA